ncbi:hypothetical protein BGX31_004080 [Mortierella sp. GBA43]|nr:hypothetical protein BGX31_004080 [Mortierella sp. GBA43]
MSEIPSLSSSAPGLCDNSTATIPQPSAPSSVTKAKPRKTDNRKVIFRPWDPQTDALIIRLYQDYNIEWPIIGQLIDRPYTTCHSRFSATLRPALKSGWFPPEIDDQEELKRLVQEARVMEELKKSELALKNSAKKALATPEEEEPRRVRWNLAQDKTIIEMVEAGETWPSIGLAVGRPYSSCYSRYYSILDPALNEPWSPDIVDQIEAWVRQGLNWREIGKNLNMRPVTCQAKWGTLSKRRLPSETVSFDFTEEISPGTVIEGKGKEVRFTFSKQESEFILELVEKHGRDNWDQILKDFQTRFYRSGKIPSHQRHVKLVNQRIQDLTTDILRHHFSSLMHRNVHWTMDQETILIQHVIQHGTEGQWDKIAQQLSHHSPEECRSRWKQLDMPVNPIPPRWGKIEQSTFWTLWLEFGSNFERLSRLCGGQHSAAECQQYFENMTQELPDPVEYPDAFKVRVEDLRTSISTEPQRFLFTKSRSIRLQKAVKEIHKLQGSDYTAKGVWTWVADKVQPGLSAAPCMEHWMYLQKNMDVIYGPLEEDKAVIKPMHPISWTHEEQKLLDQGVRELGHHWSDIQQKFLPWRTTRSLRQRWLLMADKPTTMTEEEYYTIVEAGNKSSEIDYDALLQKMPGWNRLPCQRVFETSYKHLLATTVWLPEEDQLLIKKTLELRAHDWEAIASHFDGVQTAMAPLFAETMARLGSKDDPPLRTRKTAWQCRLRWSQLLMPLIPNEQMWALSFRSVALKLSKQLLKKDIVR